jgi:hypothetical protein
VGVILCAVHSECGCCLAARETAARRMLWLLQWGAPRDKLAVVRLASSDIAGRLSLWRGEAGCLCIAGMAHPGSRFQRDSVQAIVGRLHHCS